MSDKKINGKPEVSVVMSVYNENDNDLLYAVNSILNQTYTNFEFIIVCDNPGDDRLCKVLKCIGKMDKRIKIIWNDKNIGLALSLNNGCACATGKYIARMDADDISEKTRLEKQVSLMRKGNYDLVWTSYSYINEMGEQIICEPVYCYKQEEIGQKLPYKNIIHHPTTMFKKNVFEKVGAYRNFPCSQDYDLWLRMLDVGAKMMMMDEPLLKYRIRQNSTTSRKRFQQLCTLNYIRKLYRERKRYGYDSYSLDNYSRYIRKCGIGNKRDEEAFYDAINSIEKGKKNIRKGRVVTGFTRIVFSTLKSKFHRRQIKLFIEQKIRRV